MPGEYVLDQHRRKAAWFGTEADMIESAMAASRELDQIEARINHGIDQVLEAFRSFREYADTVDALWSATPDLYDPKRHADIRDAWTAWGMVVRSWVEINEACLATHEFEATNAPVLRETYSDLLSVEIMGRGAMPDHMRRLADAAVEDIKAGKLREM